jgi:hypothetical protein
MAIGFSWVYLCRSRLAIVCSKTCRDSGAESCVPLCATCDASSILPQQQCAGAAVARRVSAL